MWCNSMITDNLSGTRMTSGMAICEARKIQEYADHFAVPSQTGNDILYRVELVHGHWVCDCPDFTSRHIEACKHIYAVQFQIALRDYVAPESKPEVIAPDTPRCKFCESIRIMRYGFKSGKQVFKCKDCNRKFVPDSAFKRLKYDPELITISLDLYFKGISLRKISDHLSQMYNLEINFSTIYKWLEKYISVLDTYVSTLTPKLSGDWQIDEMVLKVRGGTKRSGPKGRYKWLWNVMDKESRFQLACEISKGRDELDSANALTRAREIAKAIPKRITSDKLASYPMGIERTFIDVREEDRPYHNRVLRGMSAKKEGNQWVERLNNTVRERTKVQRGWKKDDTPLRKGQMLYYNFIRPHTTLGGKTPAHAAGIKIVDGENSWLELLNLALDKAKRSQIL